MPSCVFMDGVTSNRKTYIIRMNGKHINRFVNENVSDYMCNNQYRFTGIRSNTWIFKFIRRRKSITILMLRLIDTFAHMLSTLTHKLKQKRMKREKKRNHVKKLIGVFF